MQHAFQLTSPLAAADVERLTFALAALPGVRGITAAPGSDMLGVVYDEDAVSLQAIVGATARAGYSELRRELRRERGGCCGGCCGGQ